MKILGVKTLQAGDYPEAGDWLKRFLGVLNVTLNSLRVALTSNLTFADNFQCTIKTFTFVNGTESTPISHGLTSYLGVLLIKSPDDNSTDTAIESWKVRTVDNSSIAITVWFKGGSTTKGDIKFIVLGG